MKQLLPLIAGFLFAIGLGLSGMTNPEKVLGFLNVLGNWDPSLLVVLCCAVALYACGYFLLQKKVSLPPIKQGIDKQLLIGAALFGIGWGLIGLCPGPALANLLRGSSSLLIFIASMTVSMLLCKN